MIIAAFNLFSIFHAIYEAILFFVRYIANIVSTMASAVQFLILTQGSLFVVVGYLPAVIGGACLAFIAIAALRFLLLK